MNLPTNTTEDGTAFALTVSMPRTDRDLLVMADEKRISDAVIKSLRDKKLEMAGEIADKDEEIARLRALVKELSNVAERFVLCKATYCEIACGDIKENCIHKKTIELVAKAREAIGGAE